jgi:hypothetical protein
VPITWTVGLVAVTGSWITTVEELADWLPTFFTLTVYRAVAYTIVPEGCEIDVDRSAAAKAAELKDKAVKARADRRSMMDHP